LNLLVAIIGGSISDECSGKRSDGDEQRQKPGVCNL
jgi:hypothetical protein